MRKVTRYADGRVCQHPGCQTKLSIYNPDNFCNEHAGKLLLAESIRLANTSAYEHMNGFQPSHSTRPTFRIALQTREKENIGTE